MKCEIVIDKEREEQVLVYAHAPSKLTEAIEELVSTHASTLVGQNGHIQVPFTLPEVVCFTVEDGRIYAHRMSDRLALKCRLYQLEQELPDSFVRINQSCIANIKQIDRFDASFAGTLMVVFKNGEKDYVSRRNIKNVKERLGL